MADQPQRAGALLETCSRVYLWSTVAVTIVSICLIWSFRLEVLYKDGWRIQHEFFIAMPERQRLKIVQEIRENKKIKGKKEFPPKKDKVFEHENLEGLSTITGIRNISDFPGSRVS